MERGDNIRSLGSSLRIGSSSIWRNDAAEVFSRSSRDENDEEALKWAAIEKLPTFDRLRKGMLKNTGASARVVDITKLGLQERQQLLDRLVKSGEEDNKKFLLKLRKRIDRVGIELPRIEVRFEHLNTEAEAYVGSRAQPTFINFSINMLEGVLSWLRVIPSRKKQLSILKNVSGIIKPSRLILLLGPPSSGKTTLLLALAGRLDPTLKVSGKITYNGHGMNEFVPQRTAAYISQHDLHLAQLTVRETLAFSARCQGVGSRHGMLVELLRREKEANIKPDPDLDMFMKAESTEGQEANVVTDYVLKILGLEICADVLVGNEMLRGISGGQKKRLTTGEMLVGPAKALFMDEISTGLDSSTTFQIVNSLKQSVHILEATAVVSLLQPAPETFDLFDDIILISEGQIVYQGPREHVLEFFECMGFMCPERKGVADFLQEVTSQKDQEQYWARKDQPYNFVTVNEFAEAFQSFHVGKNIGDELSVPFDKDRSHPSALATKRYGVRKMELLKACFSREFLLLKRNSFVYIFKFSQLTMMAAIASTLFLRTENHKNSVADGGIFLGALFYAVSIILFNGQSEISMSIVRLPVFYKQRDFRFYPAWAYALPPWMLKIPMSFVEVSIWVFITYYSVGFDSNVQRFWRHYLLLILLNQMASSLFRCIASIGRNMTAANTFGSLAMVSLFALGGFVLSHDDIKKWWIWGFWISPLMYAQNALAVNEYLGKSWSRIPPNSTETVGIQLLKSRGLFTKAYWYWIGIGALIGFTLLFTFANIIALTFLNPLGKRQVVLSKDSKNEKKILKREGTGEANQSMKRGMVLPFEPHSLAFDNITYSLDMPQEMKNQGVLEDKLVLVKSVSGAFKPGVLTALMGVSGAGKTTLMDVLAGRKTGGYIEGTITISGYPKKQETFARISGYCEQFDIHSPHVTVYESLVYSAWLRLPNEVDAETRMMFIEEVMELVELTQLRQAMVGLPGVNGLSTEQRKRLTIAVELVANPSIIFMDEPTSGLDARAAAIVMRTVRNTVDTGRTVVCTIHQPSIDIFESFDELYLLKRGGQEIYAGPLGFHSSELIKYFQGIEGVQRIKEGYNPAAWMLNITSTAQETTLGIDFAEIYKNSHLYGRTKDMIKELSMPAPGSKDLHFPTKYSQSFFTQCKGCLWKQRCSYWCNPQYTAIRFFFTTLVSVVFGSMFWNLGSKIKKQQDVFNAMGSMYAAVLFLGVQNGATVQTIVAIERVVFYRERAAGMYSELPYAIAQVLVEMPYVLAQAVVYNVIVYAMIGFQWTASKFFWYIFFMYFSLLYFTFYGMMTVALTPNLHIGAIVSAGLYSIWNIFSGFIIPRTRIPIWWRWFSWANPFSWTLYGLVTSQYGQVKDQLDTGETVEEFLRSYFGFRHNFLGVVAVAVLGFNVVFALVFAISIKMLNFQRR